MKNYFATTFVALALWTTPALATPEAAAPIPKDMAAVVSKLKPQQGKIALPTAKATLDLGKAYDFYNAADAKTILVDIWGNPPESAQGVLGMVFPVGKSPLTDSWGAVVTYEDTGYVSDEDAADVDYAELLNQMQSSDEERNAQRKAAGYPEMKLVGWAEQPNYDAQSHSVVWAQNISSPGSKVNSLNYDVRTLGRSGVLSLNLVSSMTQLSGVKLAARDFASHAGFDTGARYVDFNESTDRKAEYGIGGLVAAGVGVAIAKKLGIFAIFLKFLKPILLGLVIFFGTIRHKIMGLFGRKEVDSQEFDQ